jgi:glycosyltransferase involved in cell wall biosynthesis
MGAGDAPDGNRRRYGDMRILLFDFRAGGHHRIYIERMVGVLAEYAEIVVAAPRSSTEGLRGIRVIDAENSVSPRAGRRETALTRISGKAKAVKELKAFERAESACTPDVSIHLFADQLLPLLVVRRPRMAPRILLLFRPRHHYREAFSSTLSPANQALSTVYERILTVWRNRSDARAILTLDEEAARRWNRGPGVSAHWLPEPPVLCKPKFVDISERSGVVLFGSLAARKGIDLLAHAVVGYRERIPVTLAGNVNPGAREYVSEHVAFMRSHGVDVELLDRRHSEEEALALLSRARCTALPYVNHFGMSRVLVETCVAGTPVVAHSEGLVGHLVRTHGLGLVANATDPTEFGAALVRLYTDDDLWASSVKAAHAFAERYSSECFSNALRGCLAASENDEVRAGSIATRGNERHNGGY